jgi:RNA polymerase sigma-70 factor, ECF subfamily
MVKREGNEVTDPLAERFEADRPHLRAVAYRMLGSLSDAEDAVQEAWIRLQRTDVDGVANLTGWLTTVVGRVCLDMLRSRTSRREVQVPDPVIVADDGRDNTDPEQEAVLGDSVGLALLVVLDTLTPAERVAFVLHDLFGVPFGEVGRLVGRSTDAAKMLASRARRRVRGETATPDPGRHREIVDAFLAASRDGDFDALVALLDPDVVLRADAGRGGVLVRGAAEVAGRALMFAKFATSDIERVLVNGVAGLLARKHGRPSSLLAVTVVDGRIVEIDVLADRDRLARLVD